MLGWYKRVRGEEPHLTGRPLYQQVIVRRSGLGDEAARRLVRRAYQSFTSQGSQVVELELPTFESRFGR